MNVFFLNFSYNTFNKCVWICLIVQIYLLAEREHQKGKSTLKTYLKLLDITREIAKKVRLASQSTTGEMKQLT